LTQFDQYRDIPKIKELNAKINDLRNSLGTQISNDFKSMERLEHDTKTSTPEALLHDACLVVDQVSL
jgi:hypothetical protein